MLSALKAACAAVTDRTSLWWAALCVFFGFAAQGGRIPAAHLAAQGPPRWPRPPPAALLSGVLTKAGIFGILVVTVYLLPGAAAGAFWC